MKEKKKVNESKHTFVLLTWKQAWKLTNANVFASQYYLYNGGAKKNQMRRGEAGGKKREGKRKYFILEKMIFQLFCISTNQTESLLFLSLKKIVWYGICWCLTIWNTPFNLSHSNKASKKKNFVKTMETPASAQKRPRLGMS